MSILVDERSRVVVQGMTGREGTFHTRRMIDYGTHVVAGVTPGKGGRIVEQIPLFNCVDDAVEEVGANAAIIFVPSRFAVDAILESAAANIRIIVCISEGIPMQDMISVYHYLQPRGIQLIGPNCPGVISPEKCKLGIMPGQIHRKGPVGVISRSGTLTYEIVHQLTRLNLGQSTCLGIGGDPIIGTSFIDALMLFENDPETEAVVMIGEIGGEAEERAAEFIAASVSKPVIAFIAGKTAPPGRRMGHAGAIISGGKGTALEKMQVLQRCGIEVVENPAQVGERVLQVLQSAHGKGRIQYEF